MPRRDYRIRPHNPAPQGAGCETERAIDKLLTRRTATPTNKLAKAASSIAPGEHDWVKRSTPDVLKAPVPTANTVIQALLDTIKRKAANDEVVAESQRTVKAALKTSDHTDLAKVHADAVRNFGDGALAELFEFQRQLGAANKGLHKSWLTAFARKLPDESRKMTEAIQLLAAESGSDNALVGGSADDDLKPKLKREMKPAPRKPEPPKAGTLANAPSGNREVQDIDLDFVHKREGELRTDLNIPKDREGKAIGKSGATVGYGVDLGQMDAAELQRLGDQFNLPQRLIDKLQLYTGKTNDEAVAFLEANPLTISKEEARELSTAKYIDTKNNLRRTVDKHLGSHGAFDSLPAPVKTVIYSLGINYGPYFLDKHEKFRGHLQEFLKTDNAEGMIKELRNYGGPPELEDRRNEEARMLEEWLENH